MPRTFPLTGDDFERIIRDCLLDPCDLQAGPITEPFIVYRTTLVDHEPVQKSRRGHEVDIEADD